MSRITKAITYNLNDRGRKYTGQDRSNTDVQAVIAHINSPATQEFVEKGDLHGFYGHQVRQLYGMIPPESVTIDGKVLMLEPAIRTVELSADKQGNVTHRQEFLDNEAGEHAYKQYKAKIGGFSTAIDYKNLGGKQVPVQFYGFDYVWQSNYATNTSYGAFDSVSDQIKPVINQMLEQEIVQIYDSIQMANLVGALAHRSMAAEQELERLKARQNNQQKKQQQIIQQQYDSALCPTIPFDQVIEESAHMASLFNDSSLGQKDDTKEKEHFNGFGKILGVFK